MGLDDDVGHAGEHRSHFETLKEIKMNLVPANVYFEQDLHKVHEQMKSQYGHNESSVPELFAGFFRFYYFQFNHKNDMISIKEGKVIPKKEPDDYIFSIEDPFDTYHNPGKTLRFETAQGNRTLDLFKKAYLSSIQGFKTLILDSDQLLQLELSLIHI
eukprot:TRINITY_DN8704_c0_g1_i1.p1 TRINITY_DN8704_c0_g1~~TRINITY_DN8704_c0_g1_i1.p1  ORF type:complete len:158 (-),score=20.97 TRINITY_DN8704_c0_g1_i1:144-617(-)